MSSPKEAGRRFLRDKARGANERRLSLRKQQRLIDTNRREWAEARVAQLRTLFPDRSADFWTGLHIAVRLAVNGRLQRGRQLNQEELAALEQALSVAPVTQSGKKPDDSA